MKELFYNFKNEFNRFLDPKDPETPFVFGSIGILLHHGNTAECFSKFNMTLFNNLNNYLINNYGIEIVPVEGKITSNTKLILMARIRPNTFLSYIGLRAPSQRKFKKFLNKMQQEMPNAKITTPEYFGKVLGSVFKITY